MVNKKILEGYGVKLHRLTEDKIELVRRWRNDPKIQQYMDYRQEITEEQQKNWFRKINNDNNFYFIIEFENKDVGLINIKNVNYTEGVGENGIFLWDNNCYGKKLSYRASIVMLDYIFEKTNITKINSHILKDNIRSQMCHKGMGYKLANNQKNVQLQSYTLTKANYFACRTYVIGKIESAISK